MNRYKIIRSLQFYIINYIPLLIIKLQKVLVLVHTIYKWHSPVKF